MIRNQKKWYDELSTNEKKELENNKKIILKMKCEGNEINSKEKYGL